MNRENLNPVGAAIATPDEKYIGRVGSGGVNTSFGELLQGVLPCEQGLPNRHFLVTLPVSLSSRAKVEVHPEQHGLKVLPQSKSKTEHFAEVLLERLQIPVGLSIHLDSDMEGGKGLSSSTADIVACARAIAKALNITISAEMVCDLLREIEPTDGLLYDGCVSFYHREVKLKEKIGTPPPLTLLSVDDGGSVDTVQYNQTNVTRLVSESDHYAQLLNKLETAIRNGDANSMGEVATQSALMNQAYNFKRKLEPMIKICEKVGGCGVIVGHSGSVSALMLDKTDSDHDQKRDETIERMKEIGGLYVMCDSVQHFMQ